MPLQAQQRPTTGKGTASGHNAFLWQKARARRCALVLESKKQGVVQKSRSPTTSQAQLAQIQGSSLAEEAMKALAGPAHSPRTLVRGAESAAMESARDCVLSR